MFYRLMGTYDGQKILQVIDLFGGELRSHFYVKDNLTYAKSYFSSPISGAGE